MEWRVGDSLRLRRQGGWPYFGTWMKHGWVVMEVHPTRVLLRRKVYHGERMPTESVLKSQIETWWKEGYLSVEPGRPNTEGEVDSTS